MSFLDIFKGKKKDNDCCKIEIVEVKEEQESCCSAEQNIAQPDKQ